MKLMGECLGPGRGELRQQRAGVPGLTDRSALLLSPHLLSVLQLLLWHSALWTVHEATPLGPARSLPQSFLLKCLEQVRKIQADGAELQERLVSEGGQRGDGEGTDAPAGQGGKEAHGGAEEESGAEGSVGKGSRKERVVREDTGGKGESGEAQPGGRLARNWGKSL